MKKPRQVDHESAERYAILYLERYLTSSARLRSALESWAERTDPNAHSAPIIDAVIERLQTLRLLDDVRVAAARVRVLRGRGRSARAIAVDLRRLGLDEVELEPSAGDELEAARRLVKRRKLGTDPARRQRDLAILGRAGFGYEVARRALDE